MKCPFSLAPTKPNVWLSRVTVQGFAAQGGWLRNERGLSQPTLYKQPHCGTGASVGRELPLSSVHRGIRLGLNENYINFF